MSKFGRSLLFFLIAASVCSFAADPATVQDIRVNTSDGNLRVEITLSAPVAPSVTTAVNPDRLVIELPDTVSDARQRRLAVNELGVKSVRYGLNSATPPVTRVVIDLEQAQQYSLATNGNQIVVSIAGNAAARATTHHGAPSAAASGSLTGIFRKGPTPQREQQAERIPQPVPAPPASSGPAWQPSAGSANSTSQTASATPSAKRPNLGSLQQGTVVPDGVAGVSGSNSTSPSSTPVFDEVAVVNGKSAVASPPKTAPAASSSPNGATISTGSVLTTPTAEPIQEVAVVNSQGSTRPPAIKPAPSALAVPSTAAPVTVATKESGKDVTIPAAATPASPAKAPAPAGNKVATAEQVAAAPTMPPAAAATPATPAVSKQVEVATPASLPPQSSPPPATASVSVEVSRPVPIIEKKPEPEVSAPAVVASVPEPVEVPPAGAVVEKKPEPTPIAPAVSAATPAIEKKVEPAAGTPVAVAEAPKPTSPASSEPATTASSSVSAATPAKPVEVAKVATEPPAPASQPAAQPTPASESAPAATEAASSSGANWPKPGSIPLVPVEPQVAPEPVQTQPAAETAASGPNWPKPGSIPLVPVEPASDSAQNEAAAANWPKPGSIPLAPLEPEPTDTVDPASAPALRTQSDLHTFFRVKYVAQGAAYLEGGRTAGLTEGMKLVVRDDGIKVTSDNPETADPRVTAQLEIVSVAETSAVTEIKTSTRDVKVGDLAWLSAADEAVLVQERTMSPTRKYPVVVSFTENGDPMDEEIRAEVPKPPLPEVNRARGRIGVDYNSVLGTGGAGYSSTQLGLVLRTDITRINGTYWNLSGYWRGRMSLRSSTGQPTLQDLLNRTYHLSMTYDNPNSAWVMGAGRMYLPWATSLDTIDGGYFGRKLKQGVVVGAFGGSTPDPTSWNYAQGRRIVGGFVNFTGGSFDSFRYFTTVGGAASTINGQFDRPFVFIENSLFYKHEFSFYSSIQADNPPGNPAVPSPGAGLARGFFTVRIQPHQRIGFDLNYNYLRDVPTYDPTLIGTGLLDKYLFQGFSAGVRAEVIRRITVYTNLGRSNRSGDKQSSLNQLYGLTYTNMFRTGLRADVHYSTFNSAFGNGSYESLSLARNLMEGSRLEVQVGRQLFTSSSSTTPSNSRFLNAIFETNFGRHYFLQSGFTFNRGSSQNYDQWNIGVGYRFDNREKKRQ